MNPAMIERLKAVENQAEAMGRGARSAYLKQQAQELGISLATLYRKLEAVSIKPTRKTLAIKPKRYQYIHMADILPSDKRRQPPKTKGSTMNIIEQEMKHSSLRKVDVEIAKIIADAHKINAESVKIAQESRWYPMMAATGLVTAIAAVLALIFKFA